MARLSPPDAAVALGLAHLWPRADAPDLSCRRHPADPDCRSIPLALSLGIRVVFPRLRPVAAGVERVALHHRVAIAPEIKNVTYNFDERSFEQDGREFTDADFAALAAWGNAGRNERNADDSAGRGIRDAGGNADTAGSRAPVGSTTLKRTAVTNTLARAESAGRGGDLLDEVGRFVSGGLTDSGLAGTLYQPDSGNSARGCIQARKGNAITTR